MGYVYVLSNPSMPGLVKIGHTDRHPDERLIELSAATGVPTAFVIEHFIKVEDAALIECQVHTALAKERVNSSREFFQVSVERAKSLLNGKLVDIKVAELLEM